MTRSASRSGSPRFWQPYAHTKTLAPRSGKRPDARIVERPDAVVDQIEIELRAARERGVRQAEGGLEIAMLGTGGEQEPEFLLGEVHRRAERNIGVEGEQHMSRRVYLDHNASTPVHPEVLAEMLPYFSEHFGNPSSVHGFGREARVGLDQARERVARFLRVAPEEIVFTSGGTESDNLGLKGLALARGRGHLITSKIEHHAVLRAGQWLETPGLRP